MTSSTQHPHTAVLMAQLREQWAPSPDDPNAVGEACESCGTVFYRRKGRRRHWCPKCSGERGAKAELSMANRAGEAYEKAVAAQLRHWTAEAQRLGLHPPDNA